MYACPLYGVHFTCSFWTSTMPPAALTSNPPRFLAPFGLLPCPPLRQRPIHHAFLLLLDFCHASRSFNVQSTTISCSFWTSAMPPAASTSNPPRIQSTTHPSHACLPTSYPQRKKATPAHQCRHCFISFNPL